MRKVFDNIKCCQSYLCVNSYYLFDFIISFILYRVAILNKVMAFNATFNNISVLSWRSVLLVEETVVPGENNRPAASHIMLYWVNEYTSPERDSNSQRQCWLALIQLPYDHDGPSFIRPSPLQWNSGLIRDRDESLFYKVITSTMKQWPYKRQRWKFSSYQRI